MGKDAFNKGWEMLEVGWFATWTEGKVLPWLELNVMLKDKMKQEGHTC